MIRIINYLYIFLFTFLAAYVNAYKLGILGNDAFSARITQSCPHGAVCELLESKYFSLTFKDTYILYKIITDVDFDEYDTLSIEHYLVVLYIYKLLKRKK